MGRILPRWLVGFCERHEVVSLCVVGLFGSASWVTGGPRSYRSDLASAAPSLLTSGSASDTCPVLLLEGSGRNPFQKEAVRLLSHFQVLLPEQGNVWEAM